LSKATSCDQYFSDYATEKLRRYEKTSLLLVLPLLGIIVSEKIFKEMLMRNVYAYELP
jgi:hypothetical protein